MDPFEYLKSLGQFHMRPGLERVEAAMGQFGDPHLSIPAVHIGGTNGKGSTASMVEGILSSFPISTGLYTSPHLVEVTERLRLNSKDVQRDVLGEKIRILKELVENGTLKDGLSYFELLTVASFLVMVDAGSNVNISEVGLGGRWDATNVLEPQAIGITSISMDHMDQLGEDPISITSEKSGIIKPSTPVVVGKVCSRLDDPTRCLKLILDVCTHNGCPVILMADSADVGLFEDLLSSYDIPDWRILEVGISLSTERTLGRYRLHRPEGGAQEDPKLNLLDSVIHGEFWTPLIGMHQAYNMGVALCLSLIVLPFSLAHARLKTGDISALVDLIKGCITEVYDRYSCIELKEKIQEGLTETAALGRMEIRHFQGKTLIIDGGHNREAASSLVHDLSELYPGKDIHLLTAMMNDKRPDEFLGEIGAMVSDLTITTLPYDRSMSVKDLLNSASMVVPEIPVVHITEETQKAVTDWISGLKEGSIGVATGSFYLYRIIDEILKNLPDRAR